jgi:hypothetical protein
VINMANLNFSQKPDPVSPLAYDTPLFNLGVNISGSETCKPKHCGACGECRHKKWQSIGDAGGDIDDSYNDGGLFDGAGWLITIFDSDPGVPGVEWYGEATFYGPVYDTQAEADAACPPGNCTNTDTEVASNVENTPVYFPLSFIRNQTECEQHSAGLPAGQSCEWFTTPNTTRLYTFTGSVGPES